MDLAPTKKEIINTGSKEHLLDSVGSSVAEDDMPAYIDGILRDMIVKAINQKLKSFGKTPSEYFGFNIKSKSITAKNLVSIIDKSIKKFGIGVTKAKLNELL